MGSSWRRPGAVLGASWGVLGRLGASCGRLGSVLEVSCARFSVQKGVKFRHAILEAIFQLIFGGFASENRFPNLEKSLHAFGKIGMFCFQAILI